MSAAQIHPMLRTQLKQTKYLSTDIIPTQFEDICGNYVIMGSYLKIINSVITNWVKT